MYLKRKVDDFLCEWKSDPNRKPLVIKGSRQVGKTESIKHFAAANYESIIEINFVRDEKYKGIISDGYEAAYSVRTAHPFRRNGAPFRFKLSKAQQVD